MIAQGKAPNGDNLWMFSTFLWEDLGFCCAKEVNYKSANRNYSLFVCNEVLRTSQSIGAMSSAVSLPNHNFIGKALSSKRSTSIVHFLSPETDNCPSWISGRERMTVINISWSHLHERVLPTRREGGGGVEPATSRLPVGRASNTATEACHNYSRWHFKVLFYFFFRENKAWQFTWTVCLSANSHEMSSLTFSEKKNQCLNVVRYKLLSALRVNYYPNNDNACPLD